MHSSTSTAKVRATATSGPGGSIGRLSGVAGAASRPYIGHVLYAIRLMFVARFRTAGAQSGVADESASPGRSSSANAALLAGLTGGPDAAAAAASAIAGGADDATKRAAAPLLIATARTMRAPAYRVTLRPELVEAKRVSPVDSSPAQLELQGY